MANPALMRIAVVVVLAVIAGTLLWPHVHSAIVRNSSSYQRDLVVNCATLDLADLDTGSRRASNDCYESVDRKHGL